MGTPQFRQHYFDKIKPELKKTLKLDNVMEIPKITHIVLNMGLGGDALKDKKLVDYAVESMGLIAGQKPVVTKARKSIAGFKIREGWPLGCRVTLRGKQMYDFLQRLVCISMPKIRDFRGLNKKSFDGRGNYSMGIKEHIVFSEIDYDKVVKLLGMDITIVTSTNNDQHALELLKLFNFPCKD